MNQLISEYKNKMQTKMEKNMEVFNTVVSNKEIEINSLKNQIEGQTQLNTTLQNALKIQLEEQTQLNTTLQNALKIQLEEQRRLNTTLQNEHNALKTQLNTLDKSYNTLDKSYNKQTQQTNSYNNFDKKYIIKTVTFDENGEEKRTVEYM